MFQARKQSKQASWNGRNPASDVEGYITLVCRHPDRQALGTIPRVEQGERFDTLQVVLVLILEVQWFWIVAYLTKKKKVKDLLLLVGSLNPILLMLPSPPQ